MLKRFGYLFLLLFLCSGCIGRDNLLPLHRAAAPLPGERLCRIAVLPFQNDSKYLQADTLVGKVFGARLQLAGDYLVAQDGDILKAYRQLQLLPGDAPGLEQLRIIADRVSVDLLISGIVLEMREDRGDHGGVNPVIVLEVQIRDGPSGEVLWTTFHRRQGFDYQTTMHFGAINTVSGLARQMADEIINLWLKKGLSQCNV